LLTGCVGAGDVASADGVEAGVVESGGGIAMAGFFAAGACFEDGADCALAAGGSRRTGVSGPAPAGGVSAAAAGSAARDIGGADSVAAKISSR
jgi:hypothetical protein